jgi:hypothetical protein
MGKSGFIILALILGLWPGLAQGMLIGFEDITAPSGYLWMPPAPPYHNIVSMSPDMVAYRVGLEPWVRSMDNGQWSLVNWGGGSTTRSIVFEDEVDFTGAWFTWGQENYSGVFTAAKWVQVVGKATNGEILGTTPELTLDQTWKYLAVIFSKVKTLEITSFNDTSGANTSYYQMDNLEFYPSAPEPGTIWLLLLAGSILLCRRSCRNIRKTKCGTITHL